MRLLCVLLLCQTVSAALPAHADEADDLFTSAAAHYQHRRWDLAVDEFTTFIGRHPDHARAHQSVFFLAEALLYAQDFDRAAARFREYLDRRGDGPLARQARFRCGEAEYLAGEYGRAKGELDRFLADYPTDPLNTYARAYLGDIAMRRGEAAAAVEHFRNGVSDFPDGAMAEDCRFMLARSLERLDRTAEAETHYRAAAKKPDSRWADDARFHLGALQLARGQHAEAVETFAHFEAELATSPWRSNARLGRGKALVKSGRVDVAGPVFESLVSDPMVGVRAQYWLGRVQVMQRDFAAAAKTLQAAAEAAPDHELILDIRLEAADSLRNLGQTSAAYAQYDRVIDAAEEGDPRLALAMHGKVRAALQADDHRTLDRQATTFAERFSAERLSRPQLAGDVRRMRAQSLLKRGQYDDAVKLLRSAAANGVARGSNLIDRYLLAQAFGAMERYPDALTALKPVLAHAKGRLKADADFTHGSLLFSMRRYAEAIGPLEAYLATSPGADPDVNTRGRLAICYLRIGQLEKAKQQYLDLLARHPRHRLLADVTEQLAEAAYQTGESQWAGELFGRMATDGHSPEHKQRGLCGLGWAQRAAGDLEAAAATFDRLLKRNPPPATAAEAAMVRGRILEQLQQPDAALAMYDLVDKRCAQTERHAEALLAAARLNDRLGRDGEAVAFYQRVADEHPRLPDLDAVLYQWAWSLEELGQTAESSKLLERLRSEHPCSTYRADATFRLAQRAYAAKDYALAGKLTAEVVGLTSAATADESTARLAEHALFLSGQIAVVEEAWPRVEDVYATFAKQFPESPSRLVAEYWVAEAAFRRDDHATAAERFDQLAAQAKDRREIWLAMIPLRRAQLLWRSKQYDEAQTAAAAIEADFPDFAQQYEADYLLGRCLVRRAEFTVAREAFEKVIRSPAGRETETAAMARWMIGETYFHQRQYAEALREYHRVESLYGYPTWQAAALLQAGKCRDLLGQPDEADKLYTQVVDRHPKTRFAAEAQQRLRKPTTQRSGAAGRID